MPTQCPTQHIITSTHCCFPKDITCFVWYWYSTQTNKSIQAIMLLPAHLDDGEKRLGVIFRVLQDVLCKGEVKEVRWTDRRQQYIVSLKLKLGEGCGCRESLTYVAAVSSLYRQRLCSSLWTHLQVEIILQCQINPMYCEQNFYYPTVLKKWLAYHTPLLCRAWSHLDSPCYGPWGEKSSQINMWLKTLFKY